MNHTIFSKPLKLKDHSITLLSFYFFSSVKFIHFTYTHMVLHIHIRYYIYALVEKHIYIYCVFIILLLTVALLHNLSSHNKSLVMTNCVRMLLSKAVWRKDKKISTIFIYIVLYIDIVMEVHFWYEYLEERWKYHIQIYYIMSENVLRCLCSM